MSTHIVCVCIHPNSPRGFSGGSVVKKLPAMQETRVRSLGQEDPLEKGMATHSGILAWRIPWTEKPGGLQSMGSQSQTRLKQLGSNSKLTKLYPLNMCSFQYVNYVNKAALNMKGNILNKKQKYYSSVREQVSGCLAYTWKEVVTTEG